MTFRSLQPNGLHVLAKIPGLVEGIEGRNIDKFGFYSALPEDQGVIAENDIPRAIREEQGVGMRGVRRTVFHRYLVEAAKKAGVPVKWGHKLVGLEQGENSVTAKFDNGVEETASFLVGCDGLHGNTRICLFGQEKADFTGLVQVSVNSSSFGQQPTYVIIRQVEFAPCQTLSRTIPQR